MMVHEMSEYEQRFTVFGIAPNRHSPPGGHHDGQVLQVGNSLELLGKRHLPGTPGGLKAKRWPAAGPPRVEQSGVRGFIPERLTRGCMVEGLTER